MPSLNLCQFIGHVGADPETRVFDNGNKIATTRIAVSEKYLDRNQQQQERTEWIGLVFNGKQADFAEKYIHKGSSIYVSGKWHNREWTDQQGNKRQNSEVTVVSVQLLDKREQAPQVARSTNQAPSPGYAPQHVYQTPPAPTPAPAQYQSTPTSYPPQTPYGQSAQPDLPF